MHRMFALVAKVNLDPTATHFNNNEQQCVNSLLNMNCEIKRDLTGAIQLVNYLSN